MKIVLFLILFISIQSLPVVVFHGLGDNCEDMSSFTKKIGRNGIDYSVCIEVGSGSISSIFMSFKKQAQIACQNLRQDKKIYGKSINLVGLSQGALIARHIIENCQFGGSVSKYLSIGGPQMGVSAIPNCKGGILCYPFNLIAKLFVYTNFIQFNLAPAGYFRDVGDKNLFLEYSDFLPDLNNERNPISYRKDRFKNLEGAMFIKFLQDTVIYPIESTWFEQWDKDHNIIPLEKSDFYIQDYIGLRYLNENKRVKFVALDGNHLSFTDHHIEQIFIPFLNQ